MKTPFVTKAQLQEIVKTYPTPFHIYDEKGIRENARKVMKAFSWNKGFQEYFAVKATPNPTILKILREEGCGTDCSSLTELMMSDRCGFTGSEIMFSSNETPACEFELAAKLGATINLDDFTHIDFLKDTIGYIPETISCRYNPGGTFQLSSSKEGFQVMDTPGDSKYGFTTQQLNTAISELTNEEMAADIISLIRRYAIGSTLISHEARIRRAVDKLKKAHKFTAIEQKWIGRIEKYLMEESVLNVGVFDEDTRFRSEGGFKKIDRIFQNKLESIVLELNEYLYDDGGKIA